MLFFGLRPDQTVVEILPIGGWYTKIVAPVVRGHGSYIAAMPPVTPGNANGENSRQAYLSILAAAPALLDKVQVVDFEPGAKPMVPDGSADLVLTFRNIHNWIKDGYLDANLRAFYAALKPGGVLGV